MQCPRCRYPHNYPNANAQYAVYVVNCRGCGYQYSAPAEAFRGGPSYGGTSAGSMGGPNGYYPGASGPSSSPSGDMRQMQRMYEEMHYMHRDYMRMMSNGPIVQTKDNKMKITNIVKQLLDKDTQTLVKAGFINGDLELTETGKNVLWGIIFAANKTAFVAEAQAVIDEAAKK